MASSRPQLPRSVVLLAKGVRIAEDVTRLLDLYFPRVGSMATAQLPFSSMVHLMEML